MAIRPWLLVVLLFCACAVGVNAQSAERLRMARAYEQGGDLKSAARIYLELYEGNKADNEAFEGVARTLIGLQQYNSLLPIAEQRFSQVPSAELASLAGSLSARSGDLKGADQWWKKAVDLGGERESVYYAIGKDQANLLLTPRAIVSFEAARKLSGDPLNYAQELAELYGANGQIERATEEVLSVYRRQHQLPLIFGRLSALMTSPEQTARVGSVLMKDHDQLPDILEIRAWYFRETGNWQKAYETTVTLDEQKQLRGNSILSFAMNARAAGQYAIALQAYGSLLEGPRQTALAAAYGYALTLDQQLNASSQIDPKQAEKIIAQYRVIIQKYADHPLAADASYRAAVLYDEVIGNQDAAREMLTMLVNKWKGTEAAANGALRLAELYLIVGRQDAAKDLFVGLSNSRDPNTADQRDLANLWLGDLQLFAGRSAEAQELYLSIAQNPRSIAANDALERLQLIMMAGEDSAGVSGYLLGLKEARFRHNSLAARNFAAAAVQARDPDMKDRCALEAALAYLSLGQSAEALAQLEPILARIPESNFGDRALLATADIMERAGDVSGAIAALTTILVQYPRSILLPETREKIRRMRGDA